jgi:hypothetical protein
VRRAAAGSFATVYKCVERGTGKDWALKEIVKSSLARHELEDLKARARAPIRRRRSRGYGFASVSASE